MNHTLATIFLSLYLISIVWVIYSLITAPRIDDYTQDEINQIEVDEYEEVKH